jgi:hypothetical protein
MWLEDFLETLARDKNCVDAADLQRYYGNRDKFGEGFVITMEKDGLRYANAAQTLADAQISFIKFRAIGGTIRQEHRENPAIRFFDNLKSSEVGCLFSNLCILALAAKHPRPDAFTYTFEDDIVSNSGGIGNILRDVAAVDAERPVDICYLGKCCENCSKMVHLRNNIWEADSPLCNHSTLIKNSFAKKFLVLLRQTIDGQVLIGTRLPRKPIDALYRHVTMEKFSRTVAVHPSVFFQDILKFQSNQRDNPWLNVIECRETQYRVWFRVISKYIVLAGTVAFVFFLFYFFHRRHCAQACAGKI